MTTCLVSQVVSDIVVPVLKDSRHEEAGSAPPVRPHGPPHQAAGQTVCLSAAQSAIGSLQPVLSKAIYILLLQQICLVQFLNPKWCISQQAGTPEQQDRSAWTSN